MLGQTIYEDTKRDIQDYANTFTHQLRNEVLSQATIEKGLQRALAVSRQYHQQFVPTVYNRLREIGANAVMHYGPTLSVEERTQEVNIALDELIHNKYYGLTLPQRLKQSHLQLRRTITRSSAVGAKLETKLLNITRAFNESYPFGAQKGWDTRLFLAEAVRMEHVVARNIAIRKAHKLVRWQISDHHTQEDVCDKLASAVDRQVEEFIAKEKLNLRPEGVYFLRDIPRIPHPNCQCTIQYVYRTKRGRKTKPQKKLNLVQRIIKAIFK